MKQILRQSLGFRMFMKVCSWDQYLEKRKEGNKSKQRKDELWCRHNDGPLTPWGALELVGPINVTLNWAKMSQGLYTLYWLVIDVDHPWPWAKWLALCICGNVWKGTLSRHGWDLGPTFQSSSPQPRQFCTFVDIWHYLQISLIIKGTESRDSAKNLKMHKTAPNNKELSYPKYL